MTPRTSRAALDRTDIARAALALIDDKGLASFSMRRLASRLGVDPMAAYRRFADQEALFDQVAVEIFAELDVAALPWDQPWPQLLVGYGVALRAVLVRHANALPVYSTRPVRSEHAAQWAIRGLMKMADEGVPSTTALPIAMCVNEYVIGHAMARTADASAHRRNAPVDPAFGPLASAAAAIPSGSHFESGLRALVEGFRLHVGDHGVG